MAGAEGAAIRKAGGRSGVSPAPAPFKKSHRGGGSLGVVGETLLQNVDDDELRQRHAEEDDGDRGRLGRRRTLRDKKTISTGVISVLNGIVPEMKTTEPYFVGAVRRAWHRHRRGALRGK